MHTERGFLCDNAFLRLAEQLRERCHYLETIDLRQGVETASETDDAKREMQVLKVCLDEIQRSKPFLVVLLGERYGWIPPGDRIRAAARDAGMPPTVDLVGKSVTELEILYGVLENKDQRKRSWFYFRTVDTTGMPPGIAAKFLPETPSDDPLTPAGKLRALKKRIRDTIPDRVREYTLYWNKENETLNGLEELDAMVAADLWSDLDAETSSYLRDAPKTWQEADARGMADFVAERTRNYVERPAITDPMLAHALGNSAPAGAWGMSVIGESGSGKSSLFGRIWQILQPSAESGEIVLLAHAAGILPLSGQVDRMLRRWVTELAAHLGIPDPLGDVPSCRYSEMSAEEDVADASGTKLITSGEIDETFTSLLGKVASKTRVVLLLDALDQFENTVRAQYLTWMPRFWPENARFLSTSIPCQATVVLGMRPGCIEQAIPEITRDEAIEIARRYYSERHHREINPLVLDALLDKHTLTPNPIPAYTNPLWLSLTLQEMNLLEADDYERADIDYAHLPGAERMQALQLDEVAKLRTDAIGVYGELLDRAGRVWGKKWTESFVCLITIGRSGWRESDLRVLMPAIVGETWNELAFAGIRRVLGNHVVQRGSYAQWDFFHAALRTTVFVRNLTEISDRQRLHGLIADHLENLPSDDPLRITETMVHLLGLGHRERAAEYMADLSKRKSSDTTARTALAALVSVLVDAVRTATDEAQRDSVTEWVIRLMDGDDDLRTRHVANIIILELNDALELYGEISAEESRGQLLKASQQNLRRLHEASPNDVRTARTLSISLKRLGGFYLRRGQSADVERALGAYQHSLEIDQRLHETSPNDVRAACDLSISLKLLGDFYLRRGQGGDVERALDAYQHSLEIDQRLHDTSLNDVRSASNLSIALNKFGDFYLRRGKSGDDERTQEAYQHSLEIVQRLYSINPNDVRTARALSITLDKIGEYYLRRGKSGDIEQAIEVYQRSLVICERLQDASPNVAQTAQDLSAALNNLGDLYLRRGQTGNFEQALEVYQRSLKICQSLHEANPNDGETARNLSVTLNKLGDYYMLIREAERAMEAYQRSLEIRQQLHEANPNEAQAGRDLSVLLNKLGDYYMRFSDTERALKIYQDSLEISEHLHRANPNDGRAAHDLSIALEKMGDFYLRCGRSGDTKRAIEVCLRSLEIRQQLHDANPNNAYAARNLSVSLEKMGDFYFRFGQSYDVKRGLENYQRSLEIRQRLYETSPNDTQTARDLSISLGRMGDIYLQRRQSGDAERALEAYQRSLEIQRQLHDAYPKNVEAIRDLYISLNKLGDFYLKRSQDGDSELALNAYERFYEIVRHLYETHPNDSQAARDLFVSLNRLGNCYLRRGENGDQIRTLEAYQHSLEIARHLHDTCPNDAQAGRDLSFALNKLGDFYIRRGESGDKDRALDVFQRSLEIRQRLYEASPNDTQTARDMSVSLKKMGDFYLNRGEIGDVERALDRFRLCTALLERFDSTNDHESFKDLEYSRQMIAQLEQETRR